MRAFSLAAALVASLVAAQARADGDPARDLSVDQTVAAQATVPQKGDLTTTLVADRADATYALNETVHLTIRVDRDAYVTVFDVGPTGEVTQLFPNKFQTDNHVRERVGVEIAGASSGARIRVGAPTGTELLKVFASNKPVTVVPDKHLIGLGPFPRVSGGVRTFTRDLAVATEAVADTDMRMSLSNFFLRTVASRAAAASAPALGSGEQPFPLLIAADKRRYAIGDKATLAVTTTQACALTVVEIGAGGVERRLYPAAGAPDAPLAADQTVFVGGGSGPELVVAGPAGLAQWVAICTPQGAATSGLPQPVATDANADTPAIQRDLASRPGAAIAAATITIAR